MSVPEVLSISHSLNMKQFFLALVFLSIFYTSARTQSVTLDFPELKGTNGHIYYFAGKQADSLSFRLDNTGRCTVQFPVNYKGIIRLTADGQENIEVIFAEPALLITGHGKFLNRLNINMPGSTENNFLYPMFDKKRVNRERLMWLQQGVNLFEADNLLQEPLSIRKAEEESETRLIEAQIRQSPLYAARFLEIIELTDKLMYMVDSGEGKDAGNITDYLLNNMDWGALYTSGEFWNIIMQYYIGLINVQPMDHRIKQELLAENMYRILLKQKEPVRSALLENIYNACEIYALNMAQDVLIAKLTIDNIEINTANPRLQKIMEVHKARKNNIVPDIAGLDKQPDGPALIMFFESGCGNCNVQLDPPCP